MFYTMSSSFSCSWFTNVHYYQHYVLCEYSCCNLGFYLYMFPSILFSSTACSFCLFPIVQMTDSWGTLVVTSLQSEYVPPIVTICTYHGQYHEPHVTIHFRSETPATTANISADIQKNKIL